MIITLDNAVLEHHGHCVVALDWYKQLSNEQRQKFIDGLGIHRATYIQQFTIDALFYISEIGHEDGFDYEVLTDLWQRIRRKVRDHHGNNESV